jgi:HlyD family secretion protein
MRVHQLRFALLMMGAGALAGCDPTAGDLSKATSKPEKAATVKVEKGPVKWDVACKGVFEAEQMAEVYLKPEAWAMPLSVKKAVPHGSTVKKGDILVELDLEKIDQAIKEQKADHELATLALKLAEDELPVIEKTAPLDLAAAQRGKKLADEDLKKFLEIDRSNAEKNVAHLVDTSKHFLEYAQEEMKQLQKMYRSKDLTEETEEIILKRQRHQVEQAEFGLKNAEIRRDQVLKVDLPRQEQAAREHAVKEDLTLEKAKFAIPLSLGQKKLALDKMRYDNAKAAERLGKLQQDREAMTVRAPVEGIVYYGKCVHGQWPTAGLEASKLQRGGMLSADEVFLTIIPAGPLFVRAQVEEKDLHLLHAKLDGKAAPAGYPDLKLPATVTEVTAVPLAGGGYEARVAIQPGKDAGPLRPGMACSLKFTAYKKDDALTVPAAAVSADDADEEVHYVYLPGKDKPEKKAVKVGKTIGGKVEIVDGVKEGDEILATKPDGKS